MKIPTVIKETNKGIFLLSEWCGAKGDPGSGSPLIQERGRGGPWSGKTENQEARSYESHLKTLRVADRVQEPPKQKSL